MTTSFKILFSIEILHDFYRFEKSVDFRFIPTEPTKQLLRNYNALYKTVGNRLVVLIKTDVTGTPFILPNPEDKFSFFMELLNPTFVNVSNIEYTSLAGQRFYFNNLSANKFANSVAADILYLTKTTEDYNNATNYTPRQFVKQAGDMYESVATSTGNTPPNTAFWIKRNKAQYASEKDLVPFVTARNAFPVSPAATQADVSVFKLNTVNNLFDSKVLDQPQHFETAVNSVMVDMSGLPDARYKVNVNGNPFEVYLSNDAVYGNQFGIIDIYNHLANGNDFALLDAAGKTKDQFVAGKNVWLNYIIRFSSRTAFWKYIVAAKGVKEFDVHPDYSFTGNAAPAPSDAFTSNIPIPLKEAAHQIKLTLFHPISSDPPLAPNPDINVSGMLTKSGSDYFCNIFLNY
jgi:hypothetical protein